MSYVFYIENKCQTTQVTMTFHIEIILFCSLCCAAYVVQPMSETSRLLLLLQVLCRCSLLYVGFTQTVQHRLYNVGCNVGLHRFRLHRLQTKLTQRSVTTIYVSATYVDQSVFNTLCVYPMLTLTQASQQRLHRLQEN